MADTGIFASTAEVQRKCGAFANSTANTEAYINDFISQAESTINVVTRYNWSDAYSGLNVDVKGLLKEAASNLAAYYVLNYDNSAFISLGHFQSTITNLIFRYNECIYQLQDLKRQDFMNNA
jgi:hypothetical protein